MLGSRREPNEVYRPWMERCVGTQSIDWQWSFDGSDINVLVIQFAAPESKILFELTWPE
jgi:hypothetical protein